MRPHCAVCGRKVDELAVWADGRGDRVFEARCHGAREEMRLERRMLQTLTEMFLLTPAVAFAAKQVEAR
jgi:hypothetical protein